jgi:hypothetical protein
MGMRSHQPGGSLQFPWTGFVIQNICAVVFWLIKSPARSGPNIERRQLDLYDPTPMVRLLKMFANPFQKVIPKGLQLAMPGL